jgi:hypothetical protein
MDPVLNPEIDTVVNCIVEITNICVEHPQLSQPAISKLSEIIRNACRIRSHAEDEINNHITERRRFGLLIHPKLKNYRMIARVLSRKHHIALNMKRIRRKSDLMTWLGANWHVIGQEFLVILDNMDITPEASDEPDR